MPRRILEGNVVSAKNDKTITVLVERRFMHPVYKKYIKSSSKYTAHDEGNTCKEGDRVSIVECRPISKSKRWTLVSDQTQGVEDAKPVAKKAKEEKAPAKKVSSEKKTAAKKAAAKKDTAKKATKTKKDA